MMQANDIRATSTESLTQAFGWVNNEQMQQHDVHELNRILFDALEQSLGGTQYDSVINDLFFGLQNNVITCDVCGSSRVVQDRFLDLGLQVKGYKGVNESLD
jgi:ubiquitin C-terminal hydrolase